MVRLTADFWVKAYMRRLSLSEIPCFVVNRGDATAGAVLVKLNTLDGRARVFHRAYDPVADRHAWDVLREGEEADVDASIAKQHGFDPDIWVLEVEDREGRHLLDEDGLS